MNFEDMKVRCPDARFLTVGWLDHYELLFRESASGCFLTIEPQKGSRVPIALWSVSAEDEKALDFYEEYPALYRRETMTISSGEGPVEAFIYVMNEDYPLGAPSRHYLKTCLQGYQDCGLDLQPLFEALQRSCKGSDAPSFELR